jgi:sialate O-acetylesterase
LTTIVDRVMMKLVSIPRDLDNVVNIAELMYGFCMKLTRRLALHALSVVFTVTLAQAQVKLPKLFSSHMVLQRDMPIHIWGEAAPAEQVTVTLQNSSASVAADGSGHWSIYFSPRPAGGPFTLSVSASNRLQFDDILIGDIWIASGQSNMELPLKGYDPATQIQNAANEIAAANYPQMRLLLVQHDASDFPLSNPKTAGWSICNPDSAKNVSAVAYFFGRSILQKERIPIGLIDATWGGSPAEAWTSLGAIGSDPALMPIFSNRAVRMDREGAQQRLASADAETGASGVQHEWHSAQISWHPAALYNAMIAPFTPLSIRGVIWYQGESNSSPGMAPLYARLFAALIQDWRARWHQADLPFLYVQLSAYGGSPNDEWGVLRQAQFDTLHLANTGMAITIDIGNEHNVHPANKQDVGIRLALLARRISYKEDLVASGPLFRYAYPDGGTMHISFDNGAGLNAKGAVESFEVAGEDGIFSPAIAKIEGDTVVVSSPRVSLPRFVRYGWANYPPPDHAPNLYNSADLPASPFSTYRRP